MKIMNSDIGLCANITMYVKDLGNGINIPLVRGLLEDHMRGLSYHELMQARDWLFDAAPEHDEWHFQVDSLLDFIENLIEA